MTVKKQRTGVNGIDLELRKPIEAGKLTNQYINKAGTIIKKVTVHLPLALFNRLDEETQRIKRETERHISPSNLIR